ncbi:DNA-directed RNA polymerase II subunit RPB1 [Platanthera zijinensis]|uniref:DNA-directed RNA polymerase II subunit RPB1 n=1 Tax=Platanthera zijinensis TaxID=2320716 RepID=A0AAP0C078_9ASPA
MMPAKARKKYAGGDDIDVEGQQDSEEPMTKSKGGCGALQPNITIDGIKMIAEYKASKKKSDDQEQLPEPIERKQVLSAERVTIP